MEFFSILLQDTNGTGADEASVNAAGAVTLTENGRLLIPNQDYVFGYNANSRTIRLTPIAGIWRKDSVYEITLNNRTGIQLSVGDGAAVADGNRYTVNYPGGTAVFEFDKGAPAGVTAGAVPVAIQNGFTPYQVAAQLVAAINSVGLGLSAYLQGDGTVMVVGATSITATGAALGAPLTINAIRDLAGNPLNANRSTSLTQFTIIMPEVRLDFGDANGVNIRRSSCLTRLRHQLSLTVMVLVMRYFQSMRRDCSSVTWRMLTRTACFLRRPVVMTSIR